MVDLRGTRKRDVPESVKEEKRRASGILIRTGVKTIQPFRQMFAAMFIPGGSAEQAAWFNELEPRKTSPECAARF